MSNTTKEWRILDESDQPIKERLLRIRNIPAGKAGNFFDPELTQLADPFLFQDMEAALERITAAIEQKERIIIFGDYDVDGVSGTAILVRTLKKLQAEVSYRLPHRINDGYGLKKHLVDEIEKTGCKLIITVDNGISAFNEITYAAEKGIDVIITDHHSIPEKLPPAVAILHPKVEGETYPFKDLSGSGVAFMLAACLLYTFLTKEEANHFLLKMLDLATLGTIADCVPLVGDNRILVTHGLRQLAQTTHPGLQYLLQIAEVDPLTVDTHTVEYIIGPRLNAGGRMDTALDALHLFLFTGEKSKEAAQKLHHLNSQRQLETQKIVESAELKLATDGFSGVIVVEGDWHIGIIGIVAARLAERYGAPAIVLGRKEDEYVASCRSDGRTDIIGLLRRVPQYFIHYGGHEGAAGFSIKAENLAVFKQEISVVATQLNKEMAGPILNIDTHVRGQEIDWKLHQTIQTFAPYGTGNEKPIFVLRNSIIRDKKLMGKERTHLKLHLEADDILFEAVGFSMAAAWGHLTFGDKIDVAFELEKNEFNGNTKLNLIIKDIRKSQV